MPIFKLKKENNSIENALLVPAAKTALEMEKHLEWVMPPPHLHEKGYWEFIIENEEEPVLPNIPN